MHRDTRDMLIMIAIDGREQNNDSRGYFTVKGVARLANAIPVS